MNFRVRLFERPEHFADVVRVCEPTNLELDVGCLHAESAVLLLDDVRADGGLVRKERQRWMTITCKHKKKINQLIQYVG